MGRRIVAVARRMLLLPLSTSSVPRRDRRGCWLMICGGITGDVVASSRWCWCCGAGCAASCGRPALASGADARDALRSAVCADKFMELRVPTRICCVWRVCGGVCSSCAVSGAPVDELDTARGTRGELAIAAAAAEAISCWGVSVPLGEGGVGRAAPHALRRCTPGECVGVPAASGVVPGVPEGRGVREGSAFAGMGCPRWWRAAGGGGGAARCCDGDGCWVGSCGCGGVWRMAALCGAVCGLKCCAQRKASFGQSPPQRLSLHSKAKQRKTEDTKGVYELNFGWPWLVLSFAAEKTRAAALGGGGEVVHVLCGCGGRFGADCVVQGAQPHFLFVPFPSFSTRQKWTLKK